MRIILRTMDLPGKSAALYRPRKSPIAIVCLDQVRSVNPHPHNLYWVLLNMSNSFTFL